MSKKISKESLTQQIRDKFSQENNLTDEYFLSSVNELREEIINTIPSNMTDTIVEEVRQDLSIKEVNKLINKKCEEFKIKLLQKNIDYNNSLYKRNIFDQEPIEGLKARISDKLNRILSKGFDDKTEDSMEDLMGYYIHYKIMRNE